MSDENPFANWPHIDAPRSADGSANRPARRTELPGSSTERNDFMSNENALERFLGGSPAAVFVKLLFVSLVVGALLMWLDIRPADIFRGVQDFINRIYALGFGAVREVDQLRGRRRGDRRARLVHPAPAQRQQARRPRPRPDRRESANRILEILGERIDRRRRQPLRDTQGPGGGIGRRAGFRYQW